MPRLPRPLVRLLVLAASATLVAGCSTVRFNQKARLKSHAMMFDADGLTAQIQGDIVMTREGAIGGFSAGGAGGCGCN
ncbi:MAG: hypothetical protein ACI9MR_003708 [Myxococcota bacterium]|jgi:hypothetical protein